MKRHPTQLSGGDDHRLDTHVFCHEVGKFNVKTIGLLLVIHEPERWEIHQGADDECLLRKDLGDCLGLA